MVGNLVLLLPDLLVAISAALWKCVVLAIARPHNIIICIGSMYFGTLNIYMYRCNNYRRAIYFNLSIIKDIL